ncbi:TRAP transporter large permease subunit, partial [Candidatus Aerophobetes bacterium]|nr:TRAP transporter large permease subunit [Candidatus Aerophobetes bacterium]
MIFGILVILIVLGIPIAFVLGITSFFYLFHLEMPLVLIPQRMFIGLNSFLLLAVPLFVVAGKLMNETGITDKLVNFASLFLGRLRGGLAYVNIVASMLFAGITGTGAADTSAIGSVMIPAMIKQGYRADYSAAVTAISSVIGPVIPPSLAMLVYGAIAQVSVAKLFLGGVIPGILLGLVQLSIAAFYARIKHHPIQ